MFKLDLEKAEEPEFKLLTSIGSYKNQENSRKTSTSAWLTTLKPLTVWIITKCGKFLIKWEYQTTLPASWEICIIIRDLIYVIPEWSSGFPYFLQFKSELGNKEFMIWATVSSWSCFCWLYRASPYLAAKNIINLILVLTIWWCPCVESSLVLLEDGVCYDQCVLLAKVY